LVHVDAIQVDAVLDREVDPEELDLFFGLHAVPQTLQHLLEVEVIRLYLLLRLLALRYPAQKIPVDPIERRRVFDGLGKLGL